MTPDDPVELVIDRLEQGGYKPKRSGSGYSSFCPGHEHHDPSLSIGELVTNLGRADHSYRQIADALEEAGYRRRSGGSWLPMTVSRIASGNLRTLKRAIERAEGGPVGKSRKAEPRYHG
jgi:hypothetical protein